jgi:hypothetical protein
MKPYCTARVCVRSSADASERGSSQTSEGRGGGGVQNAWRNLKMIVSSLLNQAKAKEGEGL